MEEMPSKSASRTWGRVPSASGDGSAHARH